MYSLLILIAVCAAVIGAATIIRFTKIELWRWRGLSVIALVAAFLVVIAVGYGRLSVSELFTGFVTMFFMLWLSITDIKGFVLPNKILMIWLMLRVFLVMVSAVLEQSLNVVLYSVAGSLVIGLMFLIVYYLSKRTLGGGDVKLSFILGLSITIERVFNATFYGLLFCTVFALIGLLLRKLNRKDVLPLGPFLFAGTIAAYLLQIGG